MAPRTDVPAEVGAPAGSRTRDFVVSPHSLQGSLPALVDTLLRHSGDGGDSPERDNDRNQTSSAILHRRISVPRSIRWERILRRTSAAAAD
jgi:hypothetical protein